MRRLAVVLLGLVAAAPALAQEAPRLCVEFQRDMEDALGKAPSSLQINNLLFEAARKGCAAALGPLKQAGASPLARDRQGDTALAIAARAGRAPFVAALVAGASEDERAEIDTADARGATPLMLAIHAGRPAVAQTLLELGARVDAADATGETALAEAAFAADEDLGAALLQKGAKPDTLDRYGKSPICYAAARGAARLVEKLLDAGVDPNARYGADLTALMWAAGYSDLAPAPQAAATVKLLIARGAKLDFVDDRGRSALMIAAALNRFDTARVLRDAGADRTLRDKSGKTAADLAATDEIKVLVR